MTTQTAMTGEPPRHATQPSSAVSGFVIFAAVIMMLVGAFHAIAGLAAIFEDEIFITTQDYLYSVDVTGWGWIHLIAGILVALAGVAVLSGNFWARSLGIVLAALSAIANFMFIPYYPVWSLLIIALDVAVIWALSVQGRNAV